ncbi:hypothetical protein PAV_109p00290 (plasmid) [Paenibacillus alvei DSM 29]|nr:hypothetical protein PAV_109p00290 [Paenibacillus alvei DSM 29]
MNQRDKAQEESQVVVNGFPVKYYYFTVSCSIVGMFVIMLLYWPVWASSSGLDVWYDHPIAGISLCLLLIIFSSLLYLLFWKKNDTE